MQIMDHPHSPHNHDTHLVLTSLLDTTSTQLNQILYDLTIKYLGHDWTEVHNWMQYSIQVPIEVMLCHANHILYNHTL